MAVKQIDCYVCGTAGGAVWAEENGYTVIKCPGCGLLYVNPRPDDQEIAEAARTGLHKGAKECNHTGTYNAPSVARFREILRVLYRDQGVPCRPGSNWLDVGCGHGEFMEAVISLSPGATSVEGVEPNEAKVSSARSRGLAVGWREWDDAEERYDTISFLNVYSHLPYPRQFLARVRRSLRAGGEVLLETGDTQHLLRRHFPDTLSLPDHLSYVSEPILIRLLREEGFRDVRVFRFHHPSFPRRTPIQNVQLRLRERLGFPSKSATHSLRDLWVRATREPF